MWVPTVLWLMVETDPRGQDYSWAQKNGAKYFLPAAGGKSGKAQPVWYGCGGTLCVSQRCWLEGTCGGL